MAKPISTAVQRLDRFVKAVVGVLLLPPVIGLARGLYQQLETVPAGSSTAALWFFWGAGVYVLVHVLLVKPANLFALNHALLARLAGWLFGGQVTTVGAEAGAKPQKPKSRGKGWGKNKNNEEAPAAAEASTLVILSPYLLPVYVILLCVGAWLLARQIEVAWWPTVVSASVGASLGFHLAMTGEDLQQHAEQFPLEMRLMALAISALCSILVTSLCLPLALPGFSLSGVFADMAASTQSLYTAIFETLF